LPGLEGNRLPRAGGLEAHHHGGPVLDAAGQQGVLKRADRRPDQLAEIPPPRLALGHPDPGLREARAEEDRAMRGRVLAEVHGDRPEVRSVRQAMQEFADGAIIPLLPGAIRYPFPVQESAVLVVVAEAVLPRHVFDVLLGGPRQLLVDLQGLEALLLAVL